LQDPELPPYCVDEHMFAERSFQNCQLKLLKEGVVKWLMFAKAL
jgi:hypothetical protein